MAPLLVHLSIRSISEFLDATCNFSQDPRPQNYQSGWVQPWSQGVCCVFLRGFKFWTQCHFRVFVIWSYTSGWTNLERPSPVKSEEPLPVCLTASSEFEASNPCAVPATCVNTNLQTTVKIKQEYGICVYLYINIVCNTLYNKYIHVVYNMFFTYSRDCMSYNASYDYIPRKQARNLHESDTLILHFILVLGDETTSICFETPTDRPCHLATHTPAKQLAYNFSDRTISFTPQSPLDWCEDPKPNWAIALRPQREKCSGVAHSRIWHGVRVKAFLFHATRWRLFDTTVFSPKSSRNSRTTWVLPKYVAISRIEAIGFYLEVGVNLGENKNKKL